MTLVFSPPSTRGATPHSPTPGLRPPSVPRLLPAVAIVAAILLVPITASPQPRFHSGTDITVQFRRDLEAGRDVTFPTGRFYLSEPVIVQGYAGTIRGGGRDSTIIEAIDGYRPTPDPFFSSEYLFTELITVYGPSGDVTFRDMTILVRGESPSAPHANPWWPGATTIDNALSVVANRPDAERAITVHFENLRIAGAASGAPGSARGHNLAYGILVYGEGSSVPVNLHVRNCEIEHVGGSGIEFLSASGGTASVRDMTVREAFRGIVLDQGIRSAGVRNADFRKIADTAIEVREGVRSFCFRDITLDGVVVADSGCQ